MIWAKTSHSAGGLINRSGNDANVRSGSKADVTLLNFDVRFTPESGHSSALSRCPFRARTGLMHCSKPGYSITSSARAITEAGTVMPSALAVLRLILRWKRVGCSNGRSAGLAPFKMRSIKLVARS